MADEPELKSTTRQRIMNPLMLAWGLVVFLISLTVAWINLSENPEDNNAETAALAVAADEETELPAAADQTTSQAVEVTEVGPGQSSSIIPEPQISDQQQSLGSTQLPLKPAPNENLLVRGDNGLKPVLGPDGLIAWQEYARPFSGSGDAPRIAILITDLGLNTKSSDAAIDLLPGQIDMAFSPYGRNLQNWMDKAREKGHEGFLMLPTEPLNYPDNDPGPHTLITDFSESDNLLRLDWLLSQLTGYVGVVNHMGSKFTASEEALSPVLTDLQSRGLMLVDGRSTRFSMAARVARRLNMPRAINDRYIDNVLTTEEIQRQLTELENTAGTFGAALGIARATPLSINEIAAWALTLEQKGIELVPITAIANRQPIK